MNAKSKILLTTFQFPPSLGGMQNYYYNLILNSGKFEFSVLTVPFGKAEEFDRAQSFEIIRKDLLYRYFWPKWLKTFFLVLNILRKKKIGLIWAGDILPFGTVAYLINKIKQTPYFVSVHGLDIVSSQKSLKKKKLLIKILQNAEFVTANSNFTKGLVTHLGIAPKKIIVIYPCPNLIPEAVNPPTSLLDEFRARYKLSGKKVLLTVGRLVKRKGHHLIIQSLPEILKFNPAVVYLIVGGGEEKDNLLKMAAELNLQAQVIFTDELSDSDLDLTYRLADLFVMLSSTDPNDAEGFGTVYLEASKYGLPSLALRGGGVSEAVEEGKSGIIINEPSVVAISRAICHALDNPELTKAIGQVARARVNREFIWPQQAAKLKDIISTYVQ